MATKGVNTTSKYAYSTFGGCDITVSAGTVVLGNMKAISYAVTRNKAPIYVMGSANPISIGRGIRGIAGTCIFAQFADHALKALWQQQANQFFADASENAPKETGTQLPSGVYQSGSTDVDAAGVFQDESLDLTAGGSYRTPWYADQTMPIDFSVLAENEYGKRSQLRIFGVEWINEGFGTSVDDNQSEAQATWMCLAVHPWTALGEPTKFANSLPSID